MARLTEHELRREENIKRNWGLLRELGIREEAQSGVLSRSEPQSRSNSRPLKSSQKKLKRKRSTPSIEPRRKSARIALLYSDKRDKSRRRRPSKREAVHQQNGGVDPYDSEDDSEDRFDDATRGNSSGSSSSSDDGDDDSDGDRTKNQHGRTDKTSRRSHPAYENRSIQQSRSDSGSDERGGGEEVNLRYDAHGSDSLAPPPERDAHGTLRFSDAPHFMPNVTPEEMFRGGSFGGAAFGPHYSTVLKNDLSLGDYLEFPSSWFEGLDVARYLLASDSTTSQSNSKDSSSSLSPPGPDSDSKSSSFGIPGGKIHLADYVGVNKYGVRAGQSLRDWENNGWVRVQDPRGWAQWYARFYLGRRTRDDERQIRRWNGVCGPKGRFRRRLLGTIARHCGSNGGNAMEGWDDPRISPVLRQTLLHWGNELTENDYKKYLKEVKKRR